MKSFIKNIIFLLIITVTVSCNSESKTEDCKLNGEKVSCDVLRGREGQGANNKELVNVQVEAQAKYHAIDNQIIFDTDLKGEHTESIEDYDYHCKVDIAQGTKWSYYGNAEKLELTINDETIEMLRKSNSKYDYTNYLIGEFYHLDSSSNTETRISFNKYGVVTFITSCQFEKP